jgi:hypothetical protein
VPVAVEGPLPERGTPIAVEGRDGGAPVGEMRSGRDGRGLALLRLEVVREAAEGRATLLCGPARLRPDVPGWMVLPARSPG